MAWKFDRIINAFSEAAADPTRWNPAMDLVSEETESYGAILLPLGTVMPLVPMSQSLLGPYERYIAENWKLRDERCKALPKCVSRGIVSDLDVTNADQMRRSAFYQELLVPNKIQWSAMIRVVAGEDIWGLAIQRTPSQGPVQPEEMQRLVQLMTPISAAATLARALGFARAEGALKAFELSSTAAFMLSLTGEVLRSNNQAQRLLGNDIMILNRRLRSRSRAASELLDRSIFEVLSRPNFDASPAIALPRELGRPVIANILKADPVSREVLSPAKAFVLLIDPDRNMVPTLEDLSRVFGLTRAESRLVIELQSGLSLSEAATRLSTTYETARTTLKQAFRKTGTSGQPDLLRLISKFRPRLNS